MVSHRSRSQNHASKSDNEKTQSSRRGKHHLPEPCEREPSRRAIGDDEITRENDVILPPFRVSRDEILLAGIDPTVDVAARSESRNHPHLSRDGIEFVSYVNEPLDTRGRDFSGIDGDDRRFRITHEPFGGRDDVRTLNECRIVRFREEAERSSPSSPTTR